MVKKCPVCGAPIKRGNSNSVTCSMACRKARHLGNANPASAVESVGQNDGTWTISIPQTRIHTLDQLIAAFEVDTRVWQVKSFVCNKWEVGAKDPAGNLTVEPLYQVKAILVRIPSMEAAQKAIDELKALAKNWAPTPRPVKTKAPGKCMLQISIADIHHGKLAWGDETDHGNYDTAISHALFREAIETLIERTRGHSYQKVLFPLGNDFFQADNLSHTTTRGTPVSVDGRWKRTYVEMRELVCWAIERLRGVAPVEVVIVPGNHDSQSMFTLGDSLQCFFANYKDVTIDNSPTLRKYVRFGRTLLGLDHGNNIKQNDLYSLMAVERPIDFAATTWREWHLGHFHKSFLNEKHGIRTRIIPSLCRADEWHSAHGFVGNLRVAEAYVWHPDECLIQTSYFYAPDPRKGQDELRQQLDGFIKK